MKLITTTWIAMAALTKGVHGSLMELRGSGEHARQLENSDYAFLVSSIRENEDWCLTATAGVEQNFAKLGFRRCDSSGPAIQLWQLDAEGKVHSAVDWNKCMIVNHGNDLVDGVLIRIADCDLDTSLNTFVHNGGTDQLKILQDDSFCVTNRGTSPGPSDTIHAKPCTNEGRFTWTWRLYYDSTPGFEAQIVHELGGQIDVKDGDSSNGNTLILGTLVPNDRGTWFLDDDGLFHSALDYSKCMQAGRGGAPNDGTKVRIFPCDKTNDLQTFTWNLWGGPIQLKNNSELCMTFRGVSANVGSDPIVMKNCEDIGRVRAGWYED